MKKMTTISALLVVSMVIVPPTMADVTFTLDVHFGTVDAEGFLEATFADTDLNDNKVTLTMDASKLQNNERVSEWYFNFDPVLDDTGWTFTWVSGAKAKDPAPAIGEDSKQADGDGIYDFVFDFERKELGAAGAATYSQSVYEITRTGLTESDFVFLSKPKPGGGPPGPFLSAAHVLSTGSDGEGSDFLGAPIPAPGAVLLGMLGLGMVGWVRRRFA